MNTLNQTLQKKFPHLEVSVLKLSEVQRYNETKRIDSEFFKKEYLENEDKIKKLGFLTLFELSYQITDFGAYSQTNMIDFVDEGILFLRNQDIKDSFINIGENAYISKNVFNRLSLKLREFDVLIPRVGTLGNAAIIENKHLPCSANQNLAVIRLKQNVNPYFVTLFLCSLSGKKQIVRTSTGNVQQWLNLSTIGKIKIPLLPMPFQLEIEKLVKDSHLALEQSKTLYKEAENLLYTELGLNPQNPLQSILQSHSNNINFRIATLKESFLKTGRLDSEYYQVKYDLMEDKLKSKGFKTLEEICSLINYGSVPTSPYSENDEGVPYIKGLNLKNLIVDETKLDKITNTQDLDSKFFTKENDIIISQMGTVGDVGIVRKEQENYIFASFTIRIRLKDIKEFNPYFVGMYIQHIAKEWYLYRHIAQASVRQNTDLPTIKNLYVPFVDIKIQEQIASHIQQSFTLRNEAKALLNEAKAKVESAISGGGG